jgi:hypothetical protein
VETIEYVIDEVIFRDRHMIRYNLDFQKLCQGKIPTPTIALACTSLRLFLDTFQLGYHTPLVFHVDGVYRGYYGGFMNLIWDIEAGVKGPEAQGRFHKLREGIYRRGM